MDRDGRTTTAGRGSVLTQRLRAYSELYKLRLASLVVFSAVLGYLIAGGSFELVPLLVLALGGTMVTGASNAINQVIERDIDAKMNRTKGRPLPTDRLSVLESLIAAGLSGVGGLLLLTVGFGSLVGILAAISLISYAFIYTPMKRVSRIAGFVGAIPGALPPMIGAVAVTGEMTYLAVVLFVFQFVWQFPHFWAIAWLQHDDYRSVGILLLPASGKTRRSAVIILAYTSLLMVLPVILLVQGILSPVAAGLLFWAGLMFTGEAVRLWREPTDERARKLMFASFWYLPLMLVTFLIDAVL